MAKGSKHCRIIEPAERHKPRTMKTHKSQKLDSFGREFPDAAIAKKIKALYLVGNKPVKKKNQEP